MVRLWLKGNLVKIVVVAAVVVVTFVMGAPCLELYVSILLYRARWVVIGLGQSTLCLKRTHVFVTSSNHFFVADLQII